MFNTLDKVATGSTVGGSTLTLDAIDKFIVGLYDKMTAGDDKVLVTLNKHAQQIARLAGYEKYLSDDMKNEFNKYGMARDFGGFKIAGVSGYRKTQDGSLVIPENIIYAFMGKVGDIDMRGDIRVYETSDNNKEVLNVKVTGFDYEFAITKPEKVDKLSIR